MIELFCIFTLDKIKRLIKTSELWKRNSFFMFQTKTEAGCFMKSFWGSGLHFMFPG